MALTKVTGQVINTSTDVTVGVLTVTSTLAVGGTVSIGGTLTYEDVTNIDSVGLITARNGIVVGSGITLSKDGDGFFTGIVTATTFKGDGSQLSNITSTTINNNADNRLITGSGTANTLEAEANITFDGTNLDLGDSKKIRLGNSNDFQVYHDGTYNVIKGSSNVLFFENSGNINFTKVGLSETYLKMVPDGAVELYYDNSKKLETSSSGVTVTGQLTCTSHINLGDGDEIKLGASEDLLIYHNGSDSYVKNTTGDLYIRDTNGNIFIQPKTDENAIKCVADGATELYYDNAKKFETASAGVDVTGRVQIDGHCFPYSDNAYDLGLSGNRWRNLYTTDLQLSNEGGSNDVDGTWGNYTIQEGENDLFLINNRSGKKYKFNLTEVV